MEGGDPVLPPPRSFSNLGILNNAAGGEKDPPPSFSLYYDPRVNWVPAAFLKQQKSWGKMTLVSLSMQYHLLVPSVSRAAEIEIWSLLCTSPRIGNYFSFEPQTSEILCSVSGTKTLFFYKSYLIDITEPVASMAEAHRHCYGWFSRSKLP